MCCSKYDLQSQKASSEMHAVVAMKKQWWISSESDTLLFLNTENDVYNSIFIVIIPGLYRRTQWTSEMSCESTFIPASKHLIWSASAQTHPQYLHASHSALFCLSFFLSLHGEDAEEKGVVTMVTNYKCKPAGKQIKALLLQNCMRD